MLNLRVGFYMSKHMAARILLKTLDFFISFKGQCSTNFFQPSALVFRSNWKNHETFWDRNCFVFIIRPTLCLQKLCCKPSGQVRDTISDFFSSSNPSPLSLFQSSHSFSAKLFLLALINSLAFVSRSSWKVTLLDLA